MPRIQPYEGQISAQGGIPTQSASPSDAGGPGLTNLGQSIESAGQNLGVVQRIVQNNATRAAVTDVHTMLAGAKAEYTKQAIDFEAKADPKDTNLWDQFYHGGDPSAPAQGSLKNYLDTYREQITDSTARQAFDRGAADLTAQFGVHFAQLQSKMAGIHAKNQAVAMIDSAQATVQSDPSTYSDVMAATMKAIDDPASDYGRAGVEQRNAIKQMATNQIASSTVRGMIGDSPQHALHSLESGEWDGKVTGEQKIALMGAAETGIRAQEVEKRRVDAEGIRQKKILSDATETKIMSQWGLHMSNPKNPPVRAMDVVNAMKPEGGLDPSVGRTILNMIDENARRGPTPPRTNPVIEQQLFKDIHRPDGDPKKIIDTQPIYDAYLKGQLNDTTRDNLRKELLDSRTPEGSVFGREKADFLKAVAPQILHPGPFGVYGDPTTPMRFKEYNDDLEARITQYRKEGKDPRALFDSRNKAEFFGRREVVDRYQNTGFGSIEQAPASAAAPPRKPLSEILGGRP